MRWTWTAAAGLATVMALAGAGHAADAPTTAPANPATAPATQPAVVDVGNRAALDAHVNHEVTVEGTVSYAEWSASGKVFLIRLKEGAATRFQAALFTRVKPAMHKAFGSDLDKALKGAKVQISGRLQLYRGEPEIIINSPRQIKVVTPPPAPKPAATQPAADGS